MNASTDDAAVTLDPTVRDQHDIPVAHVGRY
jgi:hypothetical protein